MYLKFYRDMHVLRKRLVDIKRRVIKSYRGFNWAWRIATCDIVLVSYFFLAPVPRNTWIRPDRKCSRDGHRVASLVGCLSQQAVVLSTRHFTVARLRAWTRVHAGARRWTPRWRRCVHYAASTTHNSRVTREYPRNVTRDYCRGDPAEESKCGNTSRGDY